MYNEKLAVIQLQATTNSSDMQLIIPSGVQKMPERVCNKDAFSSNRRKICRSSRLPFVLINLAYLGPTIKETT